MTCRWDVQDDKGRVLGLWVVAYRLIHVFTSWSLASWSRIYALESCLLTEHINHQAGILALRLSPQSVWVTMR